MKRVAIGLIGSLTVIALAFAVDRVALIVWRFRVERYAQQLRASAQTLKRGKTGPFISPSMSWSGERNAWAVPLLEVSYGGPEPTAITVDGNGGLSLTYLPPLLAWTRHVPWAYNQHPIQGSDTYPYNDVYILQISTLEGRPSGKVLASPEVVLDHGFPF
jgi:hypothetical protein